MSANPSKLRGRHRVNNMNPEAACKAAEGWGASAAPVDPPAAPDSAAETARLTN